MAKVTSKLQLTLPKAIADQYKIRPGDDLDWVPAGESIRVAKRDVREVAGPHSETVAASIEDRLRLFDQATSRQRARQGGAGNKRRAAASENRGWTREELYQRGLSR